MTGPHSSADETLLVDETRATLRRRWQELEERFIDDPPGVVRQADALIGDVIDEIRATLDDRRNELADRSGDVGEATTEQLRASLREYAQLFGQLTDTPPPTSWNAP